MKVLITGGAGFIGSYVCEALVRRGHEIRVLDNLDRQVHGPTQQWPAYLPDSVQKVFGDVRDREAVGEALNDQEAVIHLAAAVGVGQSMYEIQRYSAVNVIGTAVLLEEIIKRKDRIGKLLVASSMSVYGEGAYRGVDGSRIAPAARSLEQLRQSQWEMQDDSGNLLLPIATPEDKPLQPQSVYAINKRDQEEMCLSVGKAYGIACVALRMFNVYGPRQALSNPYTGVVAIFSARLLNRQPPLIFEDGGQRRDFVHVEDVAQAYVHALERDGADGLALNVGSGSSISVMEIAEFLAKAMNVTIDPIATGRYRNGDIRHCFADVSLIQQKLGWKPAWDFEEGVASLLSWLQEQRADDKVTGAYVELERRGLLK
jgi:dTDP-L-rhamnose 4-epimerase